MLRIKHISLILSLLLFGPGLRAQSLENLSLEQAINMAKQNRPAFLLAGKQVAAATNATEQSRTGFKPRISFGADLRYNTILATSIVPNFGSPNPDEKVAVQFGTPWQSSAGVTLQQAVLNPTLKWSIQAGEIREQIAQNSSEKSALDLIEAVTGSYYELLLTMAAEEYAASSLQRWEVLLQQLELQQREGRALSTEVNTAFINKENARLSLEQARQNISLAGAYLLLQMGVEGDPADISLDTRLPALYEKLEQVPADSTQLSARPEYREALLNQKLAEVNATLESKSVLPTLDLVAYLGVIGFGDENTSILNLPESWFGNSYLGLQLSVPLLDMSRGSRENAQHINRDIARIQQQQWKSQIGYEVLQAQSQVRQAGRSIEVRQANLKVAQFNLETVQNRYQEGQSLFSELQNAEDLLKQSEQQYLQAIYEYLLSNLALQKARGGL